jgi:hypothetical protein
MTIKITSIQIPIQTQKLLKVFLCDYAHKSQYLYNT